MAGAPDQIGKEAGSAFPQMPLKILGDRTQRRHSNGPAGLVPASEHAQEPLGVLSWKQTDGRDAGRDDTARASRIEFAAYLSFQARMGRESSPHHRSAQAESVQQFRIVFRDSKRQQMALPGRGGCFKAGQLADDFKEARLAMQPGSKRDMLSLEQEPHEVRCRDRFDFSPEFPDGQAVDACQEPAVAPLGCNSARILNF